MAYMVSMWALYGVFLTLGVGFIVHIWFFREHRSSKDTIVSCFLIVLSVLYIIFVGGMGWHTIMETASSCS